MAGSPEWKVYDAQGVYQAACKEPEAAAALVAFYGDGATVKNGHSITVWREGKERIPAAESYDIAAKIMQNNFALFVRNNYARMYRTNPKTHDAGYHKISDLKRRD